MNDIQAGTPMFRLGEVQGKPGRVCLTFTRQLKSRGVGSYPSTAVLEVHGQSGLIARHKIRRHFRSSQRLRSFQPDPSLFPWTRTSQSESMILTYICLVIVFSLMCLPEPIEIPGPPLREISKHTAWSKKRVHLG